MKILYAHLDPEGNDRTFIRPALVPALERISRNFYAPRRVQSIYATNPDSAFGLLKSADLAFIFEDYSSIWRQDFQFFLREADRERVPVIGVKNRRDFTQNNRGLVDVVSNSDVTGNVARINEILKEIKS